MAVLRVSMPAEDWLSASPTFNDIFTDEVVMLCGGFPVQYDTHYNQYPNFMVIDFTLPPMTIEQLDGLIRYTSRHTAKPDYSGQLISVIS
jgi:hypothetical protein